ncbi:hypothetical protein B0H34DRAFT_801082 [Crassisporium funariophilum]|nr:hypothetical protein B0H34DRAFT_801082 [Crassisporium funariophilum]
MINNRSYIPHRARHIQTLYGLKIAINGVGNAQSAKSIIDSYLERRYGDFVGDTVVRRSRVELDSSVDCAILATPQVTQHFLRDPFTLLENSGFTTSPPQFLYLLNSAGIPPTSFTNCFSPSTPIDPTAQCQFNSLSSQCKTMAATICSIPDDQKMLGHNIQIAQDNITRAFADSADIYAASNLSTAAQFELSSLQQTLTTLQLVSVMAQTDVAQKNIQKSDIKMCI